MIRQEQPERILELVNNFVQLWMRYEKMLNREMAATYGGKNTDAADINNSTVNFGLFYRLGTSLRLKRLLTMGELSEALAVPLSTATRIANGFVDDGYLKRQEDTRDRRIVLVALTEKGEELFRAIEFFSITQVQQILASLTPAERTSVFAVIHKIVSALKEVTK